jgi:hypothetical protein
MADKKKSSVHEATKEALGGSEHSKPKKEVKEMHIKKAANGGHVITHHHTSGEHEPETHTTKTDDELMDHVAQHMGTPNPGEAEADAGAPDAGAGAGAGAAAGAGAPPAGGAAPQAGPAPAAPIPGM